MNEKHAGVPLLLYEKTTTYCFSDLSLNGDLYVLNVHVLVRTRACANDTRNYAQ